MVRSYDVSFYLDSYITGWHLLCFEDDDVVYDQIYADNEHAHEMGQAFLDGCYVKLMTLERVA